MATKKNNTNKNKKGISKAKNTKATSKQEIKKNNNKVIPKEEVKESKKEKINFPVNNSNEGFKLLKIILIIVGIMLVFYIITIIVTEKATDTKIMNQESTKTSEKAEIQYENIIIGTMLNRGGNYYVMIEADGDNRVTEYDSLISTIKSSEDAPTIYKANLTDSFNQDYLGKEENYYVDDIADFKVTGSTLIKVEDGKITSALDNYDAIKNKLNELA